MNKQNWSQGKLWNYKKLHVVEKIQTKAKVRTHYHLLSPAIIQQECLQASNQKLIVCTKPMVNHGLQPKMETWWNWQHETNNNDSANAKGSSEWKWWHMKLRTDPNKTDGASAKGSNVWNWWCKKPEDSNKEKWWCKHQGQCKGWGQQWLKLAAQASWVAMNLKWQHKHHRQQWIQTGSANSEGSNK